MKYFETNTVELKEQYSDTFLKTVCAFANEGGGNIIFGISDKGKVVGVKDFETTYQKIEHKIFDLIQPIPYFVIVIDHAQKTITVEVEEGDEKPYYYRHKTYIRRNTSTIEADVASQKKMIMETKGITFEQTPLKSTALTFNYLDKVSKSSISVSGASTDFLKTTGLIGKDNNFNNAALLFADENNFWGIDTVKYNENTEKFTFRKNFSRSCILKQVQQALDVFEDVYSYEKIQGVKREKFYEVSIKAFREALINAVIHRDWQVSGNIKITFFDDRVEVLSPGALPKDINKNEFLNGFVSVPRNYIICSMFRRLGYIERMGYGISLIKKEYRNQVIKPKFKISDNFINVILPVTKQDPEIRGDALSVLQALKFSKGLSSSQISRITKISRTKVVALCNSLLEKGYIEKVGTGRGTKYTILH